MRNRRLAIITLGITMTLSMSLSGCAGIGESVDEELTDTEEESEEEEEETEEAEETTDEEATEVSLDDLSEEYKEKIAEASKSPQEDIRFFDMDDFDGDGEYEAFALVGDEPEYDFYEGGLVVGQVWFVNGLGAQPLTDGVGMGYSAQGRRLDFGDKRYVVFDDIYATGTLSYVFEVSGKEVTEAPFSQYGTVQDPDGDTFTIIDSSYDSEQDPDMEWPLGHTWKSYYFYYDKESGQVKEYGGSEISIDEANELTGHDLEAECLSPEDELGTIYYRQNGIININYSRTDTDGYIYYRHRNFCMESESFLDDWGEESDEEQYGTYLPSRCPEIAVYARASSGAGTDSDIVEVTWNNDYSDNLGFAGENEDTEFTFLMSDGSTQVISAGYSPAITGMEYADIDNDGEDEIILNATFSNTAGEYEFLYAFKDVDGRVMQLYPTRDIPELAADVGWTDIVAGDISDAAIVTVDKDGQTLNALEVSLWEKNGAQVSISYHAILIYNGDHWEEFSK